MNPNAISQIKARFLRAQEALDKLEVATDFREIEEAWVDFIHAISTIYNKLEQGAKSNGKNGAWYGGVRGLRRSDPLLSYVHHARDCDQHGIRDRAKHASTIWELEEPLLLEGVPILGFTVDPGESVGDIEFCDGTNPPKTITPVKRDIAELITVNDHRHGVSFGPPKKHLDKEVRDISPKNVAKLALAYMASVVEEAERRTDSTA